MSKAAKAARSRTGMGAPTFDFDRMLEAIGESDSRTQRVAYYLNWAADHLPFQYQPYNVIAKAVSNSKATRLPRMDSDEVVGIRRTMSGIRRALRTKYGRSLDVAADGARATVDSEDHAAVVMPKKIKRLRSAKNAVVEEHRLINVSEIRDAKIRGYMQRPVRELMKILDSEEFDRKLLPPGSPEKE